MTQGHPRMLLLSHAYANNTGDLVAFIDESYAAPSFGFALASTFYLATAYVIPVKDLDAMRSDLPGVIDGNFWPSTEAHQSEGGREKIARLINYIANGDETIIVAAMKPIDIHQGQWRRKSTRTMPQRTTTHTVEWAGLRSGLASDSGGTKIQFSEERRSTDNHRGSNQWTN